ncbi:MAG: DUF1638 domain-containing protein [Desulfosalsimonadaceae bacterium]
MAKRIVIACGVIEMELNALLAEAPADSDIALRYLDQQLHLTPEKMPDVIQNEISRVADEAAEIVLGYGLCCNGTVGVYAPEQNLYIPLVHDCVALLLGSRQAYQKAFRERAGTYYIIPGLVKKEKDPLGLLENEYVPRLGREDAEWGIHEELKHYSHIALIDTGISELEPLRRRAKENARFLGKEYAEIKGSSVYFRKILFGPYEEPDFLCLPPAAPVRQKPFLI